MYIYALKKTKQKKIKILQWGCAILPNVSKLGVKDTAKTNKD